MAETRFAGSLTTSLEQTQPWGNMSISVTGSQYTHDLDLYQISVGGFAQMRIFRGFSINLNGNYAWVRDQLHLSLAGATDEEILLQQRQLATSFNYFFSTGISYRFGSIFNNVVNPRFGTTGGQFFFQ
jgi:hypothetical protein